MTSSANRLILFFNLLDLSVAFDTNVLLDRLTGITATPLRCFKAAFNSKTVSLVSTTVPRELPPSVISSINVMLMTASSICHPLPRLCLQDIKSCFYCNLCKWNSDKTSLASSSLSTCNNQQLPSLFTLCLHPALITSDVWYFISNLMPSLSWTDLIRYKNVMFGNVFKKWCGSAGGSCNYLL